MILHAYITALLTTYGYAILTPIAVFEGPIITVIAAFLASKGVLSLWGVFLCVVMADLAGDAGFYLLGRGLLSRLSSRWRTRLGVTVARMDLLCRSFAENGAKMLFVGKWTHGAGFAILTAAGAARMSFSRFIICNLLATLPKSALFIAIGYAFGDATAQIAGWITVSSLILTAVAALCVIFYLRFRGRYSQ